MGFVMITERLNPEQELAAWCVFRQRDSRLYPSMMSNWWGVVPEGEWIVNQGEIQVDDGSVCPPGWQAFLSRDWAEAFRRWLMAGEAWNPGEDFVVRKVRLRGAHTKGVDWFSLDAEIVAAREMLVLPHGVVDVELLRQIKQYLLDHPKRIYVGIWHDPDKDVGFAVECIAGLALKFSGQEPVGNWPDASTKAAELLNLSPERAKELFYSNLWPEDLRERLEGCERGSDEYARVVAERIDRFLAQEPLAHESSAAGSGEGGSREGGSDWGGSR